MTISYRDGSQSVRRDVEGHAWHLDYQLEDRDTSRDEILANYESEANRIGGEVLNRPATHLLFRVTRPGGGVTWCRLDARSTGAYELEIIDEALLTLSVEFDADALLAARSTLDGHVAIYGIPFDVDRADLRPGSGQVLDTIAMILKANPQLRIEVQGHTDSTGSTASSASVSGRAASGPTNRSATTRPRKAASKTGTSVRLASRIRWNHGGSSAPTRSKRV